MQRRCCDKRVVDGGGGADSLGLTDHRGLPKQLAHLQQCQLSPHTGSNTHCTVGTS